MENLTSKVKEYARQQGADLVGIAGKECFGRIPTVRPDELLPEAESVVVIARRVNPYEIERKPSWNSAEQNLGQKTLITQILLLTTAFLEDQGYESVPLSYHAVFKPRGSYRREAVKHLTVTTEGELQGTEAFEKTYWENIRLVSHVRLGEEAGMGEVGLCKQLITPEFGPRISLVSIITNAPLTPGGKLKEPVCNKEECSKCIEYCHSGAITPNGYNLVKCLLQTGGLPPVEVLKSGDAEVIDSYYSTESSEVIGSGSGGGRRGGCGRCFLACPVGRRHPAKPRMIRGAPSVYRDVF